MPDLSAAVQRHPPSTTVESDGHPDVRVRLLGGFELTVGGRSLEVPPAAARLVAFLALQAQPVVRSHVAGVLWSDRDDDRAGACLRSAIWRANAGHATPVIRASRTRVGLDDASVDVRETAEAAHTQLVGGAAVAPDVLSGELLPGWYDDWVIVERERLRQLCLEAMEQMAQSLFAQGRLHRAIEAALSVVAVEPLRESAHRVLIEAHLLAGNRGRALRQFEACRDLLERELGLPPGPALLDAAARARGRSTSPWDSTPRPDESAPGRERPAQRFRPPSPTRSGGALRK